MIVVQEDADKTEGLVFTVLSFKDRRAITENFN